MTNHTFPSTTYKVKVGCGNLYIIVDYKNGKPHRVRLQPSSILRCSSQLHEALGKQTTFQLRRDPKQLIKDLRSDEVIKCKEYHIGVLSEIKKGGLGAYSCADAVARVIKMELNDVEG